MVADGRNELSSSLRCFQDCAALLRLLRRQGSLMILDAAFICLGLGALFVLVPFKIRFPCIRLRVSMMEYPLYVHLHCLQTPPHLWQGLALHLHGPIVPLLVTLSSVLLRVFISIRISCYFSMIIMHRNNFRSSVLPTYVKIVSYIVR